MECGHGGGCGTIFRIQNPWTQTRRYDPTGAYIYRWLPELRCVAPERLQAPPEAGRVLAPGYPSPIVDHSQERDRTLARFKIAKLR